MPQIISQPSTTNPPFHPIGSLDALLWKLQSSGSEYIVSAGSAATVTLEFNGTARAAGGTLTIFGQEYTVAAGASTSTTVDLTAGTAQQHATRFEQAVLANINLFPYVSVTTFQSGSNWRVTVTWNDPEAWADVYANGTISPALTIHSESLGNDPSFTEGFKLAYQLFQDDGIGGTPLTSLRSVTPKVVDFDEQDTEIDFSDIGDLNVKTTPMVNQTLILHTSDSNFLLDVFLRYGSHVSVDGETTWGSFKDSDTIKIANIALPLGDTMNNYYYRGFDDGRVKFLTSRPRISPMPKCGQRVWLWVILDVARYLAIDGDTVTNYYVEIYRYNSAGGITINSTNIGATDRVLIYPAGSDNFAFSLDGFVKYSIQIKANVVIDATPEVIEVTEVMTFRLDVPCDCAEPYREIYFLEPLGGFGTLPIWKVETIEVNQDYLTHETAIDPEATEATQRIEGGYSINSPRSWQRINLKVRMRYTKDNLTYLSYLRSSPERYVYYTPDADTAETYKFIPDAGAMQVYRQGDYAIAEMTGRLHFEMPVQKQPSINRV